SALEAEVVEVSEACGRVLAQDVHAPIDIPPCDRAAVDGYALRHADVASASEQSPVRLRLSGSVAAGEAPEVEVAPGECVKVTTGSVLPRGADAVALVEGVSLENGCVVVAGALERYQGVHRRGEEVRGGERVFERGRRLSPRDVGVLSGMGIPRVRAVRKPRVGLIVTGRELLSPEEEAHPAKTYDANTYALAAELTSMGCEVSYCMRCGDSFEEVERSLEEALECSDIVIATGGTGIGSLNLSIRMQKEFAQDVFPFLLQRRGRLLVYGVRSVPGKPLAFGFVDSKPVFALPGWPLSAMVTYHFYVKPALRRMMGMREERREVAVLASEVEKEAEVTKFAPVRL
ncbi:MAG: molybdopterin molybdotransferase MoeA, partial [Euryarchaeota archaeon]|nr:molybdopterin molybdotransferase MoeA [Euryarchaeota archaeon]